MEPWELRPARDHGLSLRERLGSVRREPGLVEALGQRLWAWSTAAYLRAWHRLSVHGREHLPDRTPFVLVANHTSHLDTLALSSLLPWRLRRSVYPIAAGDVFFETPPRAMLSALLLNALPMRRRHAGRHALEELRARLLEDPCAYVLFPEGTRSANGELQPFKAGLGMLVAGTGVPVVPCHVQGAFAAWPRHRHWPLPRRLSLRVGPPLRFPDVEDARDGWHRIAREVEAAVRALGQG